MRADAQKEASSKSHQKDEADEDLKCVSIHEMGIRKGFSVRWREQRTGLSKALGLCGLSTIIPRFASAKLDDCKGFRLADNPPFGATRKFNISKVLFFNNFSARECIGSWFYGFGFNQNASLGKSAFARRQREPCGGGGELFRAGEDDRCGGRRFPEEIHTALQEAQN